MYNYNAKIIRWVDGDTVELCIDLGFKIQSTHRARLYGVDTPERGKVNYNEARLFCEKLVPVGSVVSVDTHKDSSDKYGRYLVDIKVNDKTISQMLVEAKLGYSYFGGKKLVTEADN